MTEATRTEAQTQAQPTSSTTQSSGSSSGGSRNEAIKASLRGHDYDTQVQMLAPDGGARTGQAGQNDVHAAAAKGISGSGGALPDQAKIQQSFGGYDISNVQAHMDSSAAQATAAMGADAYATGNHIALGQKGTDLHTQAHEAAHLVQQQAGVSLSGGVGKAGDAYEQHADRVADAVVQGKSAEGILGEVAGGSGGGGVSNIVQRKPLDPKSDTPISKDSARLPADEISDEDVEICSTSVDQKGRLLADLNKMSYDFQVATASARLRWQEAADLQGARADADARISSALRDANEAARRKAIIDAALSLPDLANTLINIKTLVSATGALSRGLRKHTALVATRATNFGAKVAKELGNTIKGASSVPNPLKSGAADATIGAVDAVATEVSSMRAEGALHAEEAALQALSDALDRQESVVARFHELSCLGVNFDNLSGLELKDFDSAVKNLNKGIAMLRNLPLLEDAVALNAGGAMKRDSKSRSFIETVATDKTLQASLQVVREEKREIIVDENDKWSEGQTEHVSLVQALDRKAQETLKQFGFSSPLAVFAGWGVLVPDATIAVLSTLVSVKEVQAPKITVSLGERRKFSIEVPVDEWKNHANDVIRRLRSMKDTTEMQELNRINMSGY